MEAKFVLLDRDGVINVDRPGSVRSTADFELLPGSAKAIAQFNRKGYRVLVITNQACVGRGELTATELDAIHLMMTSAVAEVGGEIERIYVCPHTEKEHCSCRKPRPGLIHRAQQDYGFDPAQTWLVGDALRDIQAADAAGCQCALVRTGKGAGVTPPDGIPSFRDLMHFAQTVPELDDNQSLQATLI